MIFGVHLLPREPCMATGVVHCGAPAGDVFANAQGMEDGNE
jgi:hypothetical protein